MKLTSFTVIVSALESAGVRYIVAGGLAVNAHGYLRFTKDVDIVVQLVPENVERAFAALTAAGYRPSVPIAAAQFADEGMRAGWIRDKNMQVLQFWSDNHPETPIDMFVTEPFQFDEEYDRALVKPLHGAIDVRFVSMPTLIRMKEKAGRSQDLVDIENLKMRIDDNAGK
jgi:predicted nucleotidyltransferase